MTLNYNAIIVATTALVSAVLCFFNFYEKRPSMSSLLRTTVNDHIKVVTDIADSGIVVVMVVVLVFNSH